MGGVYTHTSLRVVEIQICPVNKIVMTTKIKKKNQNFLIKQKKFNHNADRFELTFTNYIQCIEKESRLASRPNCVI